MLGEGNPECTGYHVYALSAVLRRHLVADHVASVSAVDLVLLIPLTALGFVIRVSGLQTENRHPRNHLAQLSSKVP